MVLKRSLRDHGQALCPSPQIPAKDALLYRKPLHLASTTVLHNNNMVLGLKDVNCGDLCEFAQGFTNQMKKKRKSVLLTMDRRSCNCILFVIQLWEIAH